MTVTTSYDELKKGKKDRDVELKSKNLLNCYELLEILQTNLKKQIKSLGELFPDGSDKDIKDQEEKIKKTEKRIEKYEEKLKEEKQKALRFNKRKFKFLIKG